MDDATADPAATSSSPGGIGPPVSELYRDPEGYDPGEDLRSAIDVSLLLGLPLLLTGEPGCGKTSVAYWLAWHLKLGPPLVHNVKSSSLGRDLLYEFDELARFRDSNAGAKQDTLNYLRLNALGLAILLSGDPNRSTGYGDFTYAAFADAHLRRTGQQELAATRFQRQVVLIDELDKAPRDTPNDLLAEIDKMEFRIRELDAVIAGEPQSRPIVVITSNSEKSLPEPFLRRCVFHHIKSPDDRRRRDIVGRRKHPFASRTALFDEAMQFFERLRALSRAPGTAELLAWLTAMEASVRRREAKLKQPVTSLKGLVKPSLGTVAKTKDDLDLAEREMIAAGLSDDDR
jgi:MoxR-like ATPase